MIDVKVAQQQVAGVVREVLRRFHDPAKRALVARMFVDAVETVESDLLERMPAVAPVAVPARSAQRSGRA